MSNSILFILFIVLILIICFIICNLLCVDNNGQSCIKLLKKKNLQYNTKYGGDSKHLELTQLKLYFTISGEKGGLDFSQLRQVLKDAMQYGIHFIERPITEKVHVSFGTFGDFMINGKLKKDWYYDPLFFKQRTAIKNTLGDNYKIVNKSDLYSTINKLIPNGIKYLPKSYRPDEFNILLQSNNKTISYPLIFKKDFVTQQKGIKILMSREDYYNAKKELNITNDAIISEYITNPLLLNGKKMHLRVYYILSIISGISRCIPHDEYRIYLAEDEYKKDDWLNSKIHISGVSGKSKNKRYYYPDDISKNYDINIINKKIDEFNQVICMAMTISNAKNYPESYAGYHLYGADVLITDDYKVYLLEVNDRSGFKFDQNEKGWEDASRKFSYRLFSFILHSTVFPFFGIVSPPIYPAEFIGNGTLTPFGNILAGNNKCFLKPYLTASESEIAIIKKMNFYNKSILFTNIIENCSHNNIFLITSFFLRHVFSTENDKGHIQPIGYITIDNNNFLSVVIIEEYQNRGIATAMVAQLIDILYARNYTETSHNKIYINSNNVFMSKIAKKLSFTLIKSHYELNYKTLTNHIIHNKNEFGLTYRIVYGEPNIDIDFNIDKYMIKSHSQFVSFVYNFISKSIYKKHSTGNRHDKDFIYQGAELKSSLNLPILFNIFKTQLWILKNNIHNNIQIFDKMIKNESDIAESNSDSSYLVFNIIEHHKEIIKKSYLKSEYYDIDKYLITEYNMPYLLDDKFVAIEYYFLIYNSGNGILKFFMFPRYNILTAKNIYNIDDINNIDTNLVRFNDTIKKYTLSDFSSDVDLSYIDTSSNNNIFINFFEIISQYDINPYPESNAGFNECIIQIKFINKRSSAKMYMPVIHKVFNWVGIKKDNNIIDNDFFQEYYSWIRNCVVLPHFGLCNIGIKANYGVISKNITISSKIQYFIIEKIHLDFNHDRTDIKIYYNKNKNENIGNKNENIGNIKLNLHLLKNSIIELSHIEIVPTYRKQNIAINAIFILMNILRAYYAPVQYSLIFKYVKQMNEIAFELKFLKYVFDQKKKDEVDYYIKKI